MINVQQDRTLTTSRKCGFLISLALALFALNTATAAADDPTPIATDRQSALALGVGSTGTIVFWHATCGSDFSPASSYLRTLDLGSTEMLPRTLYAPAGCGASRIVSDNVATDGRSLYWLTADRNVRSIQLNGGDLRDVAHFGSGSATQGSVAVGNSQVYWTDGAQVFVAPSDAMNDQGLALYRGSNMRNLKIASDQSLYVLSGNRLLHLVPAGANLMPVHVADSVDAYDLDGDAVFYGVGSSIEYRIRGSDPVRLAALPSSGTIDGLAVTANYVYVHVRPPLQSGSLYGVSRADGSIRTLTGNTPFAAQLAVVGGNLAWFEPNAGMFDIAVAQRNPLFPALQSAAITGVEVTQGIQVDGNLVPLVGDKLTIVRVYARGVPDGNGAWSNVRATLAVSGSSHSHTSGPITLSAAGSNHSRLDDSFTFYLTPEESQPGAVRTLIATLLVPPGRPQRSTLGNRMSTSISFGPARYMTIHAFTYANSNASSTFADAAHATTCLAAGGAPDHIFRPFSDLETARQFIETTYPVSHLTLLAVPGTGTVEYDDSPFDPGNGLSQCGASLRAHLALAGMMATIPGSDRGYLMTPEFGGNGWCCNQSIGSNVHVIARGQDEVAGGGGNDGGTMAQEIGHSFGGVLSIHTWNAGNQYPRPAVSNSPGVDSDGPIGDVVGLRTAPVVQPVPGKSSTGANAAWEFMSYHAQPHWTSPFVFCKLLDYLTGGAQLCPATVEGGGMANTGDGRQYDAGASVFGRVVSFSDTLGRDVAVANESALDVSGVLFANNRAIVARTEIIEVSSGWKAVTQKGSYTMQLLDGSGRALEKVHFEIVQRPPHPGQQQADLFHIQLPWIASARSIAAYGPNGNILTKRDFSSVRPRVVLTLGPATVLRARQKIRWSSPALHVSVVYAVEYSPGGGRWLRIADGLTAAYLTLDPATLPSSRDARLRVIASTGVLTGDAVSAPFVVPPHAPVVSIRVPQKPVVVGVDIVLQGSAWDPDDGGIVNPARYVWSDEKGRLGTGLWIVPSLPAGTHTISLAVYGAGGLVGRQSAVVVVR